MSNNEYREAQQQARDAGLAKRQEARLENATYTAAEVKVLTEAALRLGRAEAAEEIAAECEKRAAIAVDGPVNWTWLAAKALADATSGRTDPETDPRPPRDPGSASRTVGDR